MQDTQKREIGGRIVDAGGSNAFQVKRQGRLCTTKSPRRSRRKAMSSDRKFNNSYAGDGNIHLMTTVCNILNGFSEWIWSFRHTPTSA